MSSASTIAPIVSLPKKSNKTTSLTKASASSKKPSTSSNKNRQRKRNQKTSSSSSVDGHSSSTQTESDDTDKSSTSQRKKRSSRGRRQQQQQKRSSAQPKLQQESLTPSLPVNMKRRRRSNSAIIYGDPHFMNDAPLPSSLPLPGAGLVGKMTTTASSLPIQQQHQELVDQQSQLQPLLQLHHLHRPTLYERSLAVDNMDSKLLSSNKSYLMDPISEIQEKLRTMLKIQA